MLLISRGECNPKAAVRSIRQPFVVSWHHGEMEMSDRYIIYSGSKSAHCCFEATVMDSTKPEIIGGEHYEDEGGKYYETVCECFEMGDAIKIAKALNATDS